MSKKNILLVDPDPNFRSEVRDILSQSFEGISVYGAGTGEEGVKLLEKTGNSLIFCAHQLLDMDFSEFIHQVKGIPALVVAEAENPSVEQVVKCIKAGAFDFLRRPFSPDALIRITQECLQSIPENLSIIGNSLLSGRIKELIFKVAPTDSIVLIEGELGTEKEIVAREIHNNSKRSNHPFVEVNCGAIPKEIIENELFGYYGLVKGDFIPGRFYAKSKAGFFEKANKGTLFLDEVEILPLDLQTQLLWVIRKGGVFQREGDSKPISVDVRIIVGTTRDLNNEVNKGNFRRDLFYQLIVFSIHLPPLREQPKDIPLLVDTFISRYNQRLQRHIHGIRKDALGILMTHSWQGNVYELENVIARALALAEGDWIEVQDLPSYLQEDKVIGQLVLPDKEYSIKKVTCQIEETLIRRALQHTGGNRTHAAKILEISHRALLYKIKEYGIE